MEAGLVERLVLKPDGAVPQRAELIVKISIDQAGVDDLVDQCIQHGLVFEAIGIQPHLDAVQKVGNHLGVATDGNTLIQRIEIVVVKDQPYRQALDDTEILMRSLYFLKNTFDINFNSLLLHTTNKCMKAPIIQYPTAHMPSPTHELGR